MRFQDFSLCGCILDILLLTLIPRIYLYILKGKKLKSLEWVYKLISISDCIFIVQTFVSWTRTTCLYPSMEYSLDCVLQWGISGKENGKFKCRLYRYSPLFGRQWNHCLRIFPSQLPKYLVLKWSLATILYRGGIWSLQVFGCAYVSFLLFDGSLYRLAASFFGFYTRYVYLYIHPW